MSAAAFAKRATLAPSSDAAMPTALGRITLHDRRGRGAAEAWRRPAWPGTMVSLPGFRRA
jgi:hypothetical protein